MGQNSFHLLSGLITSSSPVAQGGSYWMQRFTYFLTNIFTFFLWPFTPVGLQAINKHTPEHSIPCLCLQLAPGDVQTLDVCLEVSLPGISWLATLSLPLGFPCQGLLDAGFYLLHCKWNNKGITHTCPWISWAANYPITIGPLRGGREPHIKCAVIPTQFT